MQSLCVFCGSSPGGNPVYVKAARELGKTIADAGQTLVYGGGNVGLMGEVALAALAAGGRVIGVIPENLVKMEVALTELKELHVVKDMHERKATMASLSDGFIAMPGGFGTIEETFEVLTWTQLGIHHKPVGLLNVNGYYTRLVDFLDHAVQEKFVGSVYRDMLIVEESPNAILFAMQQFTPPQGDKAAWVKELDKKRNGEL